MLSGGGCAEEFLQKSSARSIPGGGKELNIL